MLKPTPSSPQRPLTAKGIESTSGDQRAPPASPRAAATAPPTAARSAARAVTAAAMTRRSRPMRRRGAVPGRPGEDAGHRQHGAEADRRRQPATRLVPAGEGEERASDQQRGGADQRRRGVGPDHQGRKLWQRGPRRRLAQYFSAARSSVSRRFSPRSGSSWPAPTTAGSSAASLRTDSFAFA